MKEDYKFINKYPKESVYRIYEELVPEHLDYDDVTRARMIKSIYEHISYDPEWLEYYLFQEDLEFLVQIMNHNPDLKNLTEEDIYKLNILFDTFLVYFDKGEMIYKIPKSVKDALLLYIPTGTHSQIDEFYHFMYGLLQSRGYITIEDAETIYKRLKPKNLNLDFDSTYKRLIRFLAVTDKFAYKFDKAFAVDEYNYIYENPDYITKFQYTWEAYQNISKYGLDISQKPLKEFYQLMNKNNNNEMIKSMLEMAVRSYGSGLSFMDGFFVDKIYEVTKDINYSKRLYQEVKDALPNWIFNGDPLNVVSKEELLRIQEKGQEEDDTVFEIFEPCPCGSGKKVNECCLDDLSNIEEKVILSTNKAETFYNLLHNLMYYYKKGKVALSDIPVIKFIDSLRPDEFIDIKDKVLTNTDFMVSYKEIRGSSLSLEEKELLEGFKRSINAKFIAVKYVDKKLMLFDEKANY